MTAPSDPVRARLDAIEQALAIGRDASASDDADTVLSGWSMYAAICERDGPALLAAVTTALDGIAAMRRAAEELRALDGWAAADVLNLAADDMQARVSAALGVAE